MRTAFLTAMTFVSWGAGLAASAMETPQIDSIKEYIRQPGEPKDLHNIIRKRIRVFPLEIDLCGTGGSLATM